jgi:hypothetical protein
MDIKIPTIAKLRKLVAVSGNVDGEGFEWGFDTVGETPLERRRELLAELLANVPDGVADSAPILTDVRTRDGFLRSFHDLAQAGETEKVQKLLDGLLLMAQGSKGDARGMALVCWAGCAWMLGNSDAIKVISEGEPLAVVGTISLWQLLDIAIRHNVPASVWTSSMSAVSLDACLQGAA